MELNIFFEGIDSSNGYQSKLLKEIDERVSFKSCILTYKSQDEMDEFDHGKYEMINYDICANCKYEEVYDMNDCLPLDRELLTAMCQYEPMAVKMLMRITEFDIFTYEEAKKLYLLHLRFWNHILESRKINFVFLSGVPHHTHDYIIHCLAMVKGIPLRIMTPMSIPYRLFTGESLYSMGERTLRAYNNMKKDEEITLPQDVEHFYQAMRIENVGMDDSLVHTGSHKTKHYKFHRKHMLQYINKENVRKRVISRLKRGLKLSLVNKDISYFKEYSCLNRMEMSYVKRTRKKISKMVTLDDYNKMARLPDYSKPFVVYMLHMQPEATTLPQGDVFVEQELAITILAKSLEHTGIQLYVKEHYVQPYRPSNFYKDLKKIRGVELVKSTVDSKEMIKRCLAVSTCTGTIILESIINGKPAFVFGKGGFENGPGIFSVGSVEDCKLAIEEIQKETYTISQRNVRMLLKAFADCSVRTFINPVKGDPKGVLSIEESRMNLVNYLCEEMNNFV